MEAKLTALKEALATDATPTIKAAQEALQAEVMAMGQALYGAAGGSAQGGAPGEGGAPPPPGGGAGVKPGDVIDADFTDAGPKS